MMQSALQALLGVVRSTVSELLRDLEKRGLVVRGPRRRDGRDVKLTPAGESVVERAYFTRMEIDDAITDAFGDPWSTRTYARLLVFERFCRHLRRACGDESFGRVYGWLTDDD